MKMIRNAGTRMAGRTARKEVELLGCWSSTVAVSEAGFDELDPVVVELNAAPGVGA